MMKAHTQKIANRIRQAVSTVDPDAEVILYDSRVRGDERPDSDWDIIVLTNYEVDVQKEREFRDQLYDLELETGAPLSLFVFSKKEWHGRHKITPFYERVSREGVSL